MHLSEKLLTAILSLGVLPRDIDGRREVRFLVIKPALWLPACLNVLWRGPTPPSLLEARLDVIEDQVRLLALKILFELAADPDAVHTLANIVLYHCIAHAPQVAVSATQRALSPLVAIVPRNDLLA